jgi:hypothetical protein
LTDGILGRRRHRHETPGLSDLPTGDVEAFREYEAQIGQLIFRAFDIRSDAPRRVK